MRIQELLDALINAKAYIRVENEQLAVSSPQGGLSELIVASLRDHKIELIKLIRGGQVPRIVRAGLAQVTAAENIITRQGDVITPSMLPLISLLPDDILRIVARVPGGAANIQDIYALSPLQNGILFHHLLTKSGDPYLMVTRMAFANRDILDRYLGAVQMVVNRHDILRTSFHWDGLSIPAQVVWRNAPLVVSVVNLESETGTTEELLARRFDPRHYRIDLTHAPLMRFFISPETGGERWMLLTLQHHVIGDRAAQETLDTEVFAILSGRVHTLAAPQPYRNLIAQSGREIDNRGHEKFFRELLGDIDSPTLPFGLLDVRGDGSAIAEASRVIDAALAKRLRGSARALGVSSASLFHVAWGHVVGRASGRDDVVFGTVLFGRMQGVLGLSINTLPVRLRFDGSGVEQSVRETHRRLVEILEHEHASLAMAQRCSAVPAQTPLFTALLNYRHQVIPEPGNAARGREGIEYLAGGEDRTNYPLELSVDDRGDGYLLTTQVNIAIDPRRICAMVNRALEQLVEALECAPNRPVSTLDILPPHERHQLLVEWNDTAAAYPADKCIHELFESQVERDPEATAVVYEDQSLSYGELNRRANQLAHHLRSLGVGPDVLVAICVERSPEMVVAILAVLKAGGAYVPLDPTYPVDRLAYMLEDSEPRVVLTHASVALGLHRQWLSELSKKVPVIDLSAQASPWSTCATHNPDSQSAGLTPQHLAYVIYTSGSTGMPKGVMIEHRGKLNHLSALIATLGLGAKDVVAQTASACFDIAVWQCLAALVVGGQVLIVGDDHARDPNWLVNILAQEKATVFETVPSMLAAILANVDLAKGLATLNWLIVTGEPFPGKLRNQWSAIHPSIPTVNAYGPAECSDDATLYISQGHFKCTQNVPIGRPIANTQIYILDSHGEPVPIGVTGEIYIGGAGVARGYLNRAELTAERFLKDPFSAKSNARMYRTGDLGCWRADGNIEYLGRNDFQVKIRGFRVELGEIETQLRRTAQIKEVVVTAREDESGDKKLVAYITSTEQALDVEGLRADLRAVLPDHMVPSAYVLLQTLPLTPNGKLDRKALPAPDADAYAVGEYEEPQGEIERQLARVWADALKVEQVGRHDNFFELGGHSLLAVIVIERMRREGLHADVRALFATPTLSALAAAVGDVTAIEVPPNAITVHSEVITPSMLPLVQLTHSEIDQVVSTVQDGVRNVQDIYPLTPLQEGILFHHLISQRGDPYLLATMYRFDTRARLDGYLAALQAVIDRHDILRTAVVWESLSEPVQVVWRQARLQVQEVELEPSDEAAKQLYERYSPRHTRLDVRQAPLMRAYIAPHVMRECWLLLLLGHHLVGDHTTLEVMQEEIKAHLLGRKHQLLAPLPFRNFVVQTRLGVSQEEHERFFRRLLADVQEPTTPFGLVDVQGQGVGIAQARLSVDASVAQRLRVRARKLGISAASVCHLAWAQVLARASGRDDVVFGTVLFGRMQGGADRAIGLFINTLPVRIRIGEEGVEASVRNTHALLTDLIRHEHAPLALAQRCSAVAAPTPLFSALLNYRHSGIDEQAQNREAWSGIEMLHGDERTNYPLTLSVDDLGAEGFSLTVQVQDSLDPLRVCEMMHTALRRLVEALECAPNRPVSTLDILPPHERHQLLVEWNDTAAAYPADKCIHELFESQVERDPEATAVVYEDQSLSYGELNRRANQLAHHLRSLGVGPDVLVAICVERSPEMVVAILAVLKAGGAYVPLDPTYPVDRLAYMLEDSEPRVVLTHASVALGLHRQWLSELSKKVPVIDLSAQASPWSTCATHNPDSQSAGLTPQHLAYVIYTSGSTGMPKGVMMTQGSLFNLLDWNQRCIPLRPTTRILQFAPFGFDVSFQEIGSTLCFGGALYLISEEIRKDPYLLGQFINEQEIQRLYVPYIVLQQLAEAQLNKSPVGLHSLEEVVTAGERLVIETAIKRVFSHMPQCRLHNHYGPTETHVVTALTLPRATNCWPDLPPIGRPIANTRIYILDSHGEPVPIGVTGEIYIGGAGVARGYLNRAQLTAERFRKDAFSVDPAARMYRTGDLGRWRGDGNIEYLGRNDYQVKIRGFRIELGEIEARLLKHSDVHEAVVLAREDQAGDKRLVAYFVADAEVEAALLREHLSAVLPEYMVPAAYVRLQSFPLTPNGKLDRKGLPAPQGEAFFSQAYEAPVGATEEALARIWAEVLGLEQVGRRDNFFDLGGHSLLAVRTVSKVRRELGVEVGVKEIFEFPSAKQMTAYLKEVRPIEIRRYERTVQALSSQLARMSEADILARLVDLEEHDS